MHVSRFLLRWLYINNLLRDRAEIQSIPYITHVPTTESYENVAHHTSSPMDIDPNLQNHPQHIHSSYPTSYHDTSAQPNEHVQSIRDLDEEWKMKALHGIALYPPGMSRLLALDSLRLEIVHDLAKAIYEADEVIQVADTDSGGDDPTLWREQREIGVKDSFNSLGNVYTEDAGDDPFLEEDTGIIREFEKSFFQDEEKRTAVSIQASNRDNSVGPKLGNGVNGDPSDRFFNLRSENIHKMGNIGKGDEDGQRQDGSGSPIMIERIQHARALLLEVNDYLPQLISISLHSSPTLKHPSLPHLDPLKTLRRLLINRCVQDPHLGIKVCWLLEAEIGRAWKTLFEHRQQTGRRLIVVLPAEKAAVIAKIGVEKRHAFDFLQDVESATAFGFYDEEEDTSIGEFWSQPMIDPHTHHMAGQGTTGDGIRNVPRLPASLSVRRCRHFGDTMHFIDRMTRISLNLKTIPHLHRRSALLRSLADLNRRLRRRMVSRGMITLDEEDQREPHDWPALEDLTVDMMKYSIHFPLDPKTMTWQRGRNTEHSVDKQRIVRIINIVTNECRLLSSRERAPFLVVCEVMDTNLSGNDARLFAVGADNIGATIQEVLGSVHAPYSHDQSKDVFTPTLIPNTILESELRPNDTEFSYTQIGDIYQCKTNTPLYSPRGGWQNNGEDWYHDGSTPFDTLRQQQLEELHQQLSSQKVQSPPTFTPTTDPDSSMYQMNSDILPHSRNEVLLNRVFGIPWSQKCLEIQQFSPFGHIKGWRLASFIMKAGEDVRREALVMQVISKLKSCFEVEISPRNRPYLRPYTIMCVGGDSGLVECVKDAKSIDEVKKETDGFISLRNYFERAYSPSIATRELGQENQGVIDFTTAQDNFLRSLVGYSLVCYILQIKDRHNANILLDREGHMMHIDFGFVLGDTPKMGKVPLFSERAPFKLTAEFWEVIGGWNFNQGGLGVRFCRMFEEAFECASRHAGDIADMIEAALLSLSRHSPEAKFLADEVKQRLRMRGPSHSVAQKTFIMDLVNTALTSWGTSTYDWLQRSMNGYI